MKTSSVLFSLSLLTTFLGASSLFQEEDQDGQAPALIKVPPRETGAAAGSVEFDAAAWKARLAAPDLAERERSFEAIVERARRDSAARTLLELLAEGSDELAWTARLALREVRQSRGFAFLPHLSMDEFSKLDPFADGLNAMLERSHQNFHLVLPPGMEAFDIPKRALQGSGVAQSRSVRVRKDANGWRIQVTDAGPDGDTTRTFEGETLKEILEQNPELEGQLGIQGEGPEDGGGWDGFRIDLGRPGMLFRPDEERILGLLELAPVPEKTSPLRTDKLGVRVAPPTPAQIEEFALEDGVGLWVESVYPATIAASLGVENGSVLLELEGKPMVTAEDVTAALTQRKDRGRVRLTWLDPTGRRREAIWKESTQVEKKPAPKKKAPAAKDE